MENIGKKWPVVFALGLLLVFGCGRSPKVVPVRGQVMQNGQPLKKIYVQFTPASDEEGRPGSQAITDAQGQFELKLFKEVGGKTVGAVEGKHIVILRDYNRPVKPPIPPPKIASIYSIPHKSPLRVDLTNEVDLLFEVDAKGLVTIKTKGE